MVDLEDGIDPDNPAQTCADARNKHRQPGFSEPAHHAAHDLHDAAQEIDAADAVQADDAGNMECAMKYLYELGHRRIGYVNPYRDPKLIPIGFAEQHYSVIRRTASYFEFCLAYGLPVLESAKDCTVTVEDAVAEGVERGFTAYVAYSFEMYMEICHYLHARNLHIPRDVSVVTFNNPPLALFADPPATCVEIPCREMGVEAGRLLLERLERTVEELRFLGVAEDEIQSHVKQKEGGEAQ